MGREEDVTRGDEPAEMHPMYAAIGPFYEAEGALTQLGLKQEAELIERVENGTILTMQTGDGTWLFPAWQFAGDGNIHQQLRPVLAALHGLDGWGAGVWLVDPHPALDGRSPRQALSSGVDPGVVAALALQDRTALDA